MARTYYSTTEIDDLIPEVKGDEALVLMCEDKQSGRANLKFLKDAIESLGVEAKKSVKSRSITAAIDQHLYRTCKGIYDKMIKDAEKMVNSTRRWAIESYDLMYDNTPYMTGHMRDSIRFVGSGPLDINIVLDEDEMTTPETLPNLHKYYDGRKAYTVYRRVGDYDYSNYADEMAKNKNWWVEGKPHPSLVHFKMKWEIDIKQRLAQKYGIPYKVATNEELYGKDWKV